MTLHASIVLTAVAVGSLIGAHRLARATWPARSPRVAIALWQALGLTTGAAAIGALVGFAVVPYDDGVAGGAVTLVRDGAASAQLGLGQIAALAAAGCLAALLVGALAAAIVQVRGCVGGNDSCSRWLPDDQSVRRTRYLSITRPRRRTAYPACGLGSSSAPAPSTC